MPAFSASEDSIGSILSRNAAMASTDPFVSAAKNAPRLGSALRATAVVRRTLVCIRRYQSLTTRSLASGCCIMSCVWLATSCSPRMLNTVMSVDSSSTTPKPMPRRTPIPRFFIFFYLNGNNKAAKCWPIGPGFALLSAAPFVANASADYGEYRLLRWKLEWRGLSPGRQAARAAWRGGCAQADSRWLCSASRCQFRAA